MWGSCYVIKICEIKEEEKIIRNIFWKTNVGNKFFVLKNKIMKKCLWWQKKRLKEEEKNEDKLRDVKI